MSPSATDPLLASALVGGSSIGNRHSSLPGTPGEMKQFDFATEKGSSFQRSKAPEHAAPASRPVIMDFSPQPAVDPILASSSKIELFKRNQIRNAHKNRKARSPSTKTFPTAPPTPSTRPDNPATSQSSGGQSHHSKRPSTARNKSFDENDIASPPMVNGQPGQMKDWHIPPEIGEEMKHMQEKRHVELLKHCELRFSGLRSFVVVVASSFFEW